MFSKQVELVVRMRTYMQHLGCLDWSTCKSSPDLIFLSRLQRSNRSPGPGPQVCGRHSPANAVTSMVSMNMLYLNAIRNICKLIFGFFPSCPHPLHLRLSFVKCTQQKIRAETNRLGQTQRRRHRLTLRMVKSISLNN